MDFTKLKEWGNKIYICKCGFKTLNKNKNTHIDSELCWWLSNYKFCNVTGTEKINCKHCNKSVTVCGFPAHMKKCLEI
jgi:hypothetical protein